MIGDTIIVAVAHPDDAEISMGGTIAKLISLKKEVIVVIYALSSPVNDRLNEAKAGIEILNAKLNILSFEERQVADVEMKKIVFDMDNIINKFKPDSVFTHHPQDAHLDHRLLSQAVMSSARKDEFNLIHFEQATKNSLAINEFAPNLYVDISDYTEQKYMAIAKHQSQQNTIALLDYYQKRDSYYGSKLNVNAAEAFIISRIRY